MRCLERYSPAYLSTLSETLEGTTIRAGYVFEYYKGWSELVWPFELANEPCIQR